MVEKLCVMKLYVMDSLSTKVTNTIAKNAASTVSIMLIKM